MVWSAWVLRTGVVNVPGVVFGLWYFWFGVSVFGCLAEGAALPVIDDGGILGPPRSSDCRRCCCV